MEKMDSKCCGLGFVTILLLVIGGLNWGLIGIGGFVGKDLNIVNMVLGQWPTVEWIVYILVGVAALWKIVSWNRCCMGKCSANK